MFSKFDCCSNKPEESWLLWNCYTGKFFIRFDSDSIPQFVFNTCFIVMMIVFQFTFSFSFSLIHSLNIFGPWDRLYVIHRWAWSIALVIPVHLFIRSLGSFRLAWHFVGALKVENVMFNVQYIATEPNCLARNNRIIAVVAARFLYYHHTFSLSSSFYFSIPMLGLFFISFILSSFV